MSNQEIIKSELERLGCDLPVVKSPSFSVPPNYFEELAATILAKVKSANVSDAASEMSELSPLLSGIPKVTPYSVPSFYFESNLQYTPSVGDEVESSTLAIVGKNLPYDVPAGYFESLPAQILAKVSAPQAKVVPLFARKWMRIASAAVVGGALLFGVLQILGGRQATKPTADASADTSSNYIAQAKPVQAIKKASTKDLEEFIQTAPATAKKLSSSKEGKELLKDVSVNEMESFLSSVPQTDDDLSYTDQP